MARFSTQKSLGRNGMTAEMCIAIWLLYHLIARSIFLQHTYLGQLILSMRNMPSGNFPAQRPVINGYVDEKEDGNNCHWEKGLEDAMRDRTYCRFGDFVIVTLQHRPMIALLRVKTARAVN